MAFEDLLTDKELEELYIDSLAEGEIWNEEVELFKTLKVPVQLTDEQRAGIRKQVAETAKNDPGLKDQSKKWLSGKSSEEIKTTYQQKYIKQPAPEPDKRSDDEIEAEKQAELAKQQKAYDQMDQDRTAIYHWKQQSMKVMENGKKAGKSDEEIYAMLPAPPVLKSQGASATAEPSGQPGIIQKFVESTGIGDVFEKISPWLAEMELAYGIPQKPDYLSKQSQKTVYFSRYTFEKLIIGPKILIAEFNIMFGVVAIIAAIPTGGASLYLLAAADIALGVSTIVVNVEKLNDLKNGNPNTNPTFLGMDQDLLDKLGITLMVINLAILAKHGLNKTADKLVNNQNNLALSDTWAAWKQQVSHVPTIPSRKTGPKIAAKTKPSKGTLGGPGKNQPMDEFDDSHLYDGASKGRTSTRTDGTGDVKYKEGYYLEHLTGEIEKVTEWKGVSGGHNYEEFKKFFSENGKYSLQVVKKLEHPDVPGIYDLEYRMMVEIKDYTGKGTGKFKYIPKEDKPPHKKTIYDPNVISNDEIIRLGKEAMEEGISRLQIEKLEAQNKEMIRGTSSNGLKFEAIRNIETGEIENFWPVLKFSNGM
ncbi:hypothetical protein PAECIP112173_01480 [Paenibacillus sp. JJ-100]|uniref:CdiA family toxin C-terminal domain-containing protein n=1 Tax=Paenibacillus sp. JJ-100 TaxID=2974896 RepID=UPI0022FF7A72|nr:CdiA family toxin C-terminal domain-containing protein [Paenibacillus sp. JJ-100]CAI6053280.1 hypothetical protein PAECIP112173_01480 [Paenibacillus sp. JJ-100]